MKLINRIYRTDKNYGILIFFFFVAVLSIGLYVIRDYGIHLDQVNHRVYGGKTNWDYIFKTGKNIIWTDEPYYQNPGPVFEIFLMFLEKALNLRDIQRITLMRHIATFLFFYAGIFFFYRLCSYHFKSRKAGFLGIIFLVLSPRILAHSFYNSIDITFMVMFIISAYTNILFVEKKTLILAFLHALACAVLIDLRNCGAIMPFFTFTFILFDTLTSGSKITTLKKNVPSLLTYILLLSFFTILFWPYLWEDPVNRFIGSFMTTFHEPMNAPIKYLGKTIMSANPPWHYTFVWMAVTTPIVYTVLFFFGLIACINIPFNNTVSTNHKKRVVLFVLWFFLPILAAIVLKSTLFNGWRHHYFVYPAFILISLMGLFYLFEYIRLNFYGTRLKVMNAVLIFVVAFSVINTAYIIYKSHPRQYDYFNVLAGNNVEKNFEYDYWKLSDAEIQKYITGFNALLL